MKHILELTRLGHKPKSTIGNLYWKYKGQDRNYECLILEDEKREVKVAGETRIPAGFYEIKEREVPSPLTMKYRDKFDWFKWHLELQNVPNFNYVYIHKGAYHTHTDACLIAGTDPGVKDGEYAVWYSTKAFKKLYIKITKLLHKGDRVFIRIVDVQ